MCVGSGPVDASVASLNALPISMLNAYITGYASFISWSFSARVGLFTDFVNVLGKICGSNIVC